MNNNIYSIRNYFKKLQYIGTPKVEETNDYIKLNWNDVLFVAFESDKDFFIVRLSGQKNGEFCDKIDDATKFLEDKGFIKLGYVEVEKCGDFFAAKLEKYVSFSSYFSRLHGILFS